MLGAAIDTERGHCHPSGAFIRGQSGAVARGNQIHQDTERRGAPSLVRDLAASKSSHCFALGCSGPYTR